MLENIDKNKNPFKVPENYFENFNSEMMDKLPTKEEKKTKIVSLWRKIVPWTAVAAMLFGALFMTGVIKQGTTDSMQLNSIISSSIASNSLEEDYFLFLEDEVADAQYKEMMFSY